MRDIMLWQWTFEKYIGFYLYQGHNDINRSTNYVHALLL